VTGSSSSGYRPPEYHGGSVTGTHGCDAARSSISGAGSPSRRDGGGRACRGCGRRMRPQVATIQAPTRAVPAGIRRMGQGTTTCSGSVISLRHGC